MATNPPTSSPTSSMDVESLNILYTNDTPCHIITKFIDSIGDILATIDNTDLKKILRLCSERAYNFRNQNPLPSLRDCINTMIRDQNTLERESKYYHYYNAMILEFLQRSMTCVNAKQEHIDDLTPKLIESLEKFKEFYETV